jgi:hypothetical protein
MRSTELHGERRGLNLHLVGRVVRFRRIFLEVWIFRNVGNEFQNFVADHFSATAAKGEDGVPHQDHTGAGLVVMAYLVNSRLLDQLSGNQRAITLIKCFNVGVIQFHDGSFSVSFLPPQKARSRMGSNSANQKWDAFRVEGSWSIRIATRSFAVFLFRQPRAEDRQRASLIKDSSPAR